MARAKQPDKQLNIRMKPGQYRKLHAAARREKVTVTAYARDAIMDRVNGVTLEGPGLDRIPVWLIHLMLFFTQRGPSRSKA